MTDEIDRSTVPKFDSVRTCPKCTEVRNNQDIKFNKGKNLLSVTCPRCGYWWSELPEDEYAI